jgi:quercetin dioxygenase-like cupin family protein
MQIFSDGSRPTRRAPAEYFVGAVWQDPIVTAEAPARLMALRVSFEPGARTNWHTHPLGQTLYVVSGVGRVQREGEPVQQIRAGDTVWIAPGEKHWHGAAPDHAMTHIAMQEALDGSAATWLEPVSDADYVAAVSPGG